MKKSYEILPPGMAGSAKVLKPYEIVPTAGLAEQGLVGWTKGASAIARGLPAPGKIHNQSIGLPYDPAGAVPAHSGHSALSPGKAPKPYEIMPATGFATRGCGGKSGGCGCGGKCGGGSGHEAHSPAMQKSGGCGPGKVGGCGCGGKCGGGDGGILLPPSTGLLRPPPWTPSGSGPAGGTGIARDVVMTGGAYGLGGSPEFSADLRFLIRPPGAFTCAEMQKIIDSLLERIYFLETAPTPPRGACGECLPGMMDCDHPCDVYMGSPMAWACVCSRLAQGLDTGTTQGNWSGCPGFRDSDTPEQRNTIRRDAHDICNRGQVVADLLRQLNWWLNELRSRGCTPNPPNARVDCDRHPELCRNLFDCAINWWHPRCYRVNTDPLPPIPPPIHNADCDVDMLPFREAERVCLEVSRIRRNLIAVVNALSAQAPSASLVGCALSPACDRVTALRAVLETMLDGPPFEEGVNTRSDLALMNAREAVRQSIAELRLLENECSIDSAVLRGLGPARGYLCTERYNQGIWGRARTVVQGELGRARDAVRMAAVAANNALDLVRESLEDRGCEVPAPLPISPD